MNDDEERQPQPKLRWFQVSLRTLLALVLGVGLGLALNYRFRSEENTLPNLPDPTNIRRGDRLRIEWQASGNPWTTHTVTVLSDGSIRLRELGGVPAAGMSMDELTVDLKSRYDAYCGTTFGYNTKSKVFVDFAAPSKE